MIHGRCHWDSHRINNVGVVFIFRTLLLQNGSEWIRLNDLSTFTLNGTWTVGSETSGNPDIFLTVAFFFLYLLKYHLDLEQKRHMYNDSDQTVCSAVSSLHWSKLYVCAQDVRITTQFSDESFETRWCWRETRERPLQSVSEHCDLFGKNSTNACILKIRWFCNVFNAKWKEWMESWIWWGTSYRVFTAAVFWLQNGSLHYEH